jgi:hypothetical protein
VTSHPGNHHLLDFVQDAASRYTAASSARELKTEIISAVVSAVRNQSEGRIGFVKPDEASGHWMVLEDALARAAVGQAFRNHLQGYRSSRQSKQAKRHCVKQDQGHTIDTAASPCNQAVPALPPPLPRVISADGPVEQTKETMPALAEVASDQYCFDQLYAFFAMDEKHAVEQGNPYEPTPLQEACFSPRTPALASATGSSSRALQEALDRTKRARSYIAMLRQAGITSVPVPVQPPRQVISSVAYSHWMD